jgi:hypothetical protein
MTDETCRALYQHWYSPDMARVTMEQLATSYHLIDDSDTCSTKNIVCIVDDHTSIMSLSSVIMTMFVFRPDGMLTQAHMFIAKNPIYMTLALATKKAIPPRLSLLLHAYAVLSTERATGTRVTSIVSSPLQRMRNILRKNGVVFSEEASREVVKALKKCGLVMAHGEALLVTHNVAAIVKTLARDIHPSA